MSNERSGDGSYGKLKLLAGNANPNLGRAISDYVGTPLSPMIVENFSDGETKVMVDDNVRGTDTFILQPTSPPVNETLMELLIIIDALKRASARRITAVIPYYGYGRQDRKTRGREPITSKLVANLLTTAGADRVLTIDLHAGQIQGFFDIPLDHLSGTPILSDHFKSLDADDLIVVSPDAGGVARARDMAQRLGGVNIAIVDKHRPSPNVSFVMNIIGDVRGKVALIVDEMIDTAGTICRAAEALIGAGAREVRATATHPVLSGPAIQRLSEAPISELVVTDTIPTEAEVLPSMKVLSVAPLLGEAILRIHTDRSVSALFQGEAPPTAR
ncbi:MAG: ribose-phosphate pyrophosphokinase [Bacillota bacterium]